MDKVILENPKLALLCLESDVPRDGTVMTRTVGGKAVAIARHSANSDTTGEVMRCLTRTGGIEPTLLHVARQAQVIGSSRGPRQRLRAHRMARKRCARC